MYSREYMFETISKICDRFEFIPYECFDIDGMILKIKIEDQQGNEIDTIKIDPCSFNENTLDKLYDKLLNAVPNKAAEKHIVDWRPISEYSRDKYDWVLVKYFDGAYECVPEVAEMRVDGKWYNRTGALIDPDIFEVNYFFDMQQLDKVGLLLEGELTKTGEKFFEKVSHEKVDEKLTKFEVVHDADSLKVTAETVTERKIQWLSAKEVAEANGLSVECVRKQIKDGFIPLAEKVGGKWKIPCYVFDDHVEVKCM